VGALDHERLVALARTTVTRDFSEVECQVFLDEDTC
jgi:hypothetical protein